MTDAEAMEKINALGDAAWVKKMLVDHYTHMREAEGASVADAFGEMLDLYKAILTYQETN